MKKELFTPKKLIVSLFLIVFSSWNISAQESCQTALEMALDQYRLGRFSKIKQTLNDSCIEVGNQTLTNINRAKEFLALVAIAEDLNDKASDYIREIIIADQDFVFQNGETNFIFKKIKDALELELKQNNTLVRTVSKRPEDIRSAPATVELIEAKDIVARGYVDLIDLLSDIPGFEISKTHSVLYANVHQLGFRQTNTERTLLMIDGVEENDLWLNWAYMSRQYPISNIKQVEIIYGPASTMYGSGAFVGTINIITYQKTEKPGNYFGARSKFSSGDFYLYGSASSGSFNSKDFDFTFGSNDKRFKKQGSTSKKSGISFQVTGRYYSSDEHDMTSAPFFNYDVSDLSDFEYSHLNTSSFSSTTEMNSYVTDSLTNNNTTNQNLIETDSSNNIVSLSQDGLDYAYQLDTLAYNGIINGNKMAYSNHTEDVFIGARLDFRNFTLGFRAWKRTEGFNTLYQDVDVAPSKNGTLWSPENQTIYLKYNDNLNDNLKISLLSTFKNHKLGRQTNRVNFRPFGDPDTSLTLVDLMNYDADQNSENYTQHGWTNRFYFYQALQGRTDLRLFYTKEKFSFTFGADYRIKSTQGDYLFYQSDYQFRHEDPATYEAYVDNSWAQEVGTVSNQSEGSNMYLVKNFGSYLQGSFNINKKLFINAGIRYDIGRTRATQDINVFSPRLGVAYSNDQFTVKANYSRGFQTASLFTKYSTGGNRQANPDIQPEEIDYIDLSFMGNNEKKTLRWGLTAYTYRITNAVALTEYDATDTEDAYSQNENSGTYEVLGAMANLKYVTKGFRVDLNGTFFSPNKIDTIKTRIGDIASIRANLGVTKMIDLKGIKASINLRANYVGKKPLGGDTTQSSNLGLNESNEIPAYYVLNGNLILGHEKFPFAKLALSVNNILNALYYHPGARTASGYFDLRDKPDSSTQSYADWINDSLFGKNPSYIPQRPRYFILKLILDI